MCKHYLVEFCPFELFQNTKSDIGTCPKRYHEEALRDKYRTQDGDRYRQEWERDFYQFIEKLVADLERKLRKGKDRLDYRPTDMHAGANPAVDELEERRTLLDLQIKEKLVKIERCGEEGRIQEAQDLSDQVDTLRVEVEQILKQEAENPNFRLEKRMEVCQTCGAFLIVGDALKRIESHFEGRQHVGWARVRQTLESLNKKYGHDHRQAHRYEQRGRDTREHGEVYDRGHDRRNDRRDDYRRERSPPRRR